VWRWEDVKMRRCEDEKVWRWEDEIQTPTIGRTLRSDALGNKGTQNQRQTLNFSRSSCVKVRSYGAQCFNACGFGVCSTTLRYQPYQLVVLLIDHIIPNMLLQSYLCQYLQICETWPANNRTNGTMHLWCSGQAHGLLGSNLSVTHQHAATQSLVTITN
jgi:hypothetical protein